MIRQANQEDAAQIIALRETLAQETDFMLHEAGEETLTLADQEHILASFTQTQNKSFWVAQKQEQLVGFCVGVGGNARRNKHSLYCVVGVMQAFTGQGIGRALMAQLEDWAKEKGFTRIELTVMAHNQAARQLYLSQGFEEEGVKRQSLLLKTGYVDEIYMSKLL